MIISQPAKPDIQPAADTGETKIMVGLEDIRVSYNPHVVLACLGLGSCIAVSAYDPVARVGAMAHIVLPDSGGKDSKDSPGKYADTGIPWMIEEMMKSGAVRSRTSIKIAGGARIFGNIKEGSMLDIGFRNLAAVKQTIINNDLILCGENTGGSHGRSLFLYISTGLTLVTTATREKIVL